ncbi:MAG: FAD-dependent oxidoreductase [Pseudonocardiaceae bacterium]
MDVRADVIVVGAGVIGLTVGVCLAEQGLRVQVCSRSAPSATTSAVASAMIWLRPDQVTDAAARVRERVSFEEFTALAALDGTGGVVW